MEMKLKLHLCSRKKFEKGPLMYVLGSSQRLPFVLKFVIFIIDIFSFCFLSERWSWNAH